MDDMDDMARRLSGSWEHEQKAKTKNSQKEFIVKETIPASWGTLRGVSPGVYPGQKILFFESSRGTIRIVNLVYIKDGEWTVNKEDKVVVLKRSK